MEQPVSKTINANEKEPASMEINANEKESASLDERKPKKKEVEVEFLRVQSEHQKLKQTPKEQRLKNHATTLKSLYKRMLVLSKRLPNGDLLPSKVAKTAAERKKQVKSNCYCKYLSSTCNPGEGETVRGEEGVAQV